MRACFPLSGSRRSSGSKIFGVRGMGSLSLLPFELDAAEEVPPLIIPELRPRLPRSPDPFPCCLSGANLFYCSSVLRLSGAVPPPLLMGSVGGSGVPNLRRVGDGGRGAHAVAAPNSVVVAAIPGVGACAPLPLGGNSV